MNITFSKHSVQQIEKRGISKEEVLEVINNPDKQFKMDNEVTVYQALDNDKKYLLRIFVNVLKKPNLIVTAYKTSKKAKYED